MQTASNNQEIVNINVPVKNVQFEKEEGYSVINLTDNFSFVISNKFVSTNKDLLNFNIQLFLNVNYVGTYNNETFLAPGHVIINNFVK